MRLLVTGPARHPTVNRQSGVVEEHPAERRAVVGRRVIARRVVSCCNVVGLADVGKVSWEAVGVAVGWSR